MSLASQLTCWLASLIKRDRDNDQPAESLDDDDDDDLPAELLWPARQGRFVTVEIQLDVGFRARPWPVAGAEFDLINWTLINQLESDGKVLRRPILVGLGGARLATCRV